MRRLYFSKGDDLPTPRYSHIIKELNETIETVTFDLTVTRELCNELTESLVNADTKNRQTQRELDQLSETLVRQIKAADEIEEVRKASMKKFKTLEEENKKEREARVKEQKKYDKRDKRANDTIKRLFAEKKSLEETIDRLKIEDSSRAKKEPSVEPNMEERLRLLETELLGMKQQTHIQPNKHQQQTNQPNNNKQHYMQRNQNKQRNHNKQQNNNRQRHNNTQQNENTQQNDKKYRFDQEIAA
jgi:hypothetical protein